MTQQEALDILKMGYNVFLTGPPGSGKTFLLNQYITYLKTHHKSVAITASTGIAATHMNGTTIHSWSGLGIKEKLSKQDFKKLLARHYLKKRFKNTNALIIDEISMLHSFQFDLLNKICQRFKNNQKPFGGMQIICSGDLFQLPPVEKTNKPANFFVESKAWQNMDIKVCYLTEQHRQAENDILLALLNHIRSNAPDKAREILLNAVDSDKTFPIVPTKLYTHNVDVDIINHFELDKINEKKFAYQMYGDGQEKIIEFLKKSCLAPEKLLLKKGARVMFVKNNFERGYVNGTLGKIIDFDKKKLPIVKTFQGRYITATPAIWTIEEDERTIAKISQIPLRLAWAITVHKSQGMNLDAAEIDLSKSFIQGMGYVALSRLRSLFGLKLAGINDLALMVNEKVLELDDTLRGMSEQILKKIKTLPKKLKFEKQKNFLHSLPSIIQSPTKKIEAKPLKNQISTYDKTKTLVEAKLSIETIAQRRGLSQGAIITHLEKLKLHNKDIDLEYLRPPEKRFQIIKAAFLKSSGLELSPVREILGESFSYQELKIARLFFSETKY